MKILFVLLFTLLGLVSFSQQSLHIYGGRDHDIYLGCLNCDSYKSTSIWNEYGTYGSPYNSNSVWNQYGQFGSSYSDTSPFNQYASHPPVIVDKDGGFYGYFTINEYKDKRANFKLVEVIYEYYEFIPKDISGWYKKIFD